MAYYFLTIHLPTFSASSSPLIVNERILFGCDSQHILLKLRWTRI